MSSLSTPSTRVASFFWFVLVVLQLSILGFNVAGFFHPVYTLNVSTTLWQPFSLDCSAERKFSCILPLTQMLWETVLSFLGFASTRLTRRFTIFSPSPQLLFIMSGSALRWPILLKWQPLDISAWILRACQLAFFESKQHRNSCFILFSIHFA